MKLKKIAKLVPSDGKAVTRISVTGISLGEYIENGMGLLERLKAGEDPDIEEVRREFDNFYDVLQSLLDDDELEFEGTDAQQFIEEDFKVFEEYFRRHLPPEELSEETNGGERNS